MQPEQMNPRQQPAPQPGPTPRPAPQPLRAGPSPAPRRSRLSSVILGAAVIVALGVGAVTTGLVHIPGSGTTTGPPPVAAVTETAPVTATAPQQAEEGDHTIGVRIATLTPELAQARQINTARTSGVIFQEVFANSPADQAGLHTNDIILAIDGVPIERMTDVLNKVRLTPIGQAMAVTVERAGATQEAAVVVSRCHIREAPKGPLAPGMVTACRSWTAN